MSASHDRNIKEDLGDSQKEEKKGNGRWQKKRAETPTV
jgi:hypothetical protein